MAAIAKKINIRMGRCMDQLLALKADVKSAEDARQLAGCIEALRKAQADMNDLIHGGPVAVSQPPVLHATAPTAAHAARYVPQAPKQPAQPAHIPPRNPDGSYVNDRDDPESDGFIPFDHPWRFEQDHGQKPDGYRSDLDKPKGHWTSATELARSMGDDIVPDDAGGITF